MQEVIRIQNTKKKYLLSYEVGIIILAVIAVTITILDLTSVIILSQGSFLYWLDFSILIIFVIDYFTRLFFSKEKKEFIKGNIFDLISIIPFNSMFRIFRAFRLFRVLKITKVFRLTKMAKITKMTRLVKGFALLGRLKGKLKVFVNTNGFIYTIYITITTVLLSTVGVYFIEFKAKNIPFSECLWWSFATTTTVGYGGIDPETFAARLISAILMLLGIGFTGMLTGTIATYFLKLKDFKNDDVIKENFIDVSDLEMDKVKQISDYVEFIRNRN